MRKTFGRRDWCLRLLRPGDVRGLRPFIDRGAAGLFPGM